MEEKKQKRLAFVGKCGIIYMDNYKLDYCALLNAEAHRYSGSDDLRGQKNIHDLLFCDGILYKIGSACEKE